MLMREKKVKMLAETRGDKIFDIFINVIMGFILLIYIYPLIFIISASVSDPNPELRGEMWLFPKGFTLMGYKHILQYKEIWTGYLNTIKIVLLGVPIAMSLTISAGYVLSRKEFKLRNLYMGIFVFTMFFNGGLIPTYLVIKQLNMLDTIWALILPNAITMYYVIIVRTYYNTNIPEELHEAGVIDGCSDIRFLTSVALPLAKPITAVMALFYMVDRWNMYFRPLIYLSDRKLYPLQLILREIVASSNMTPEMLEGFEPSEYAIMVQISNLMKYGVLIVASLPVLLIYPFVQKYFVQGIMIGALKG